MNRVITILVALCMTSGLGTYTIADVFHETREERDNRMQWWREARFGMFIHWGLYSAAGGTWEGRPCGLAGCAMQYYFQIPHREYREVLMPKLTGERFDPDFIADLAKEAGMKYVVAVTKHHDGFCMYDSALTDYKITNTPAQRDWIAELADSVRDRDLKIGFYYSLFDWAHPDYPVDHLHPERNNPASAARQHDFDRYLEFMHGQYRELMTNYGRVDIIWHDFSYGDMVGEKWRATELMRMIRSKHPHIISNNRLSIIHEYGAGDLGFSQDFFTPEQYIPPRGIPGQDFEVCQTINNTWEYTHYDRDWKSTTTLIRELIDTVSKGGNYLLNIGPKPDGSIPETTIDKLRAMGRWMDVHGESIYGTNAAPFTEQPEWGRFTQKQLEDGTTRLYLHMFKWPFDAVLRVPAIENEVLAAHMLSLPGQPELAFERDPNTDELLISLPIAEPNDYATVVMLDVAGEVIPLGMLIRPDDQGTLTLAAGQAEIVGTQLNYAPQNESLGHWVNVQDYAQWQLRVDQPGRYRVDITYGSDANEGGGTYAIKIGDTRLTGNARPTDSWIHRRTDTVGEVTIEAAGTHTLRVKQVEKPNLAVIDLQKVVLVPVGN